MPPLPMPSAWAGPLPEAAPPSDMALFQLPTGTYETRAVFAFRGGSFRDKRPFAATSVLVQHPKGDLLIDAGFGSQVDAHMQALPRIERAPHQLGHTVSEQFEASGYDRSRLRGVLVTHSHWDHVSGLDDLRLPIWINEGELQYAGHDKGGRVFREISVDHKIHQYAFKDGPYLGFSSSYDVYDDGSVVVVPAGGHTTGSVITFVTLPGGRRYAFIGDLTWQLDAIVRRSERPLMMRMLADTDPKLVREDMLRMIALAGVMRIVPSHDVSAYDGIPRLLD
ncbi:MBL fold metallo-hydrolase [Streptomyces actuosus]|uniref:MBL fold metallo-hydrolase n=1 Tax=Streptomyces actuosus TaxID=1885 RepID=A0ABS2VVF6_STRAS|nr:MBL fold metallo-hydrolase [Streptomyces actuosus]MBN0047107.1 MBL fold metallo-hydrolase [Streptomyces actuosus]